MNNILNLRKVLLTAVVTLSIVGFSSCSLDDDKNYILYPNALVTIKTDVDNSLFFQLDDSTTLLPVNMDVSPFGDKEVRALLSYDEVDEPSGKYTKAIHANWIDSILTKKMVPNMEEENDVVYGKDPVEIVNDWVTIAEDGYLTLRFRTMWNDLGKPHYVNLLSTNNPDNPYEVEFRHNADGDEYGTWGDGLVAFDLSSLPDTEGKIVKLKLKWISFSGEKSTEFDYSTRKSTPVSPSMTSVRNLLKLK